MTETEVDAAMSRILYRRVWTHLVTERERRAASSTWLDLILVGRRAVPALVSVAIALAVWYWLGGTRQTPSMANVQDSQLERVALGGATMVSDDDVLTFVMNWPLPARSGQEGQR